VPKRNGGQDGVPVGRETFTVLGILLVSVLALGALVGCAPSGGGGGGTTGQTTVVRGARPPRNGPDTRLGTWW
jgi:hypothetical protein